MPKTGGVTIWNTLRQYNAPIYNFPKNGKFIQKEIIPKNLEDPGIFLGNNWNKDNMGPIIIPSKNDLFEINDYTDWEFLIPIIIMDGNKAVSYTHLTLPTKRIV